MCGIVGVINLNKQSVESERLLNLQHSVSHRGPDYEGTYIEKNVGLGHNRLAVIDPTPAANQPYVSEDKNYALVFNGTIYNFKSIRKKLRKEGYKFKTESDTEVVLNSYIQWKEKCLDKFNGVFSFVIYDRKNNEIFLSRDRYGTKPLYYYKDQNKFVFGSELKVFSKHPGIKKEVDVFALKEYFAFQNVFSDRTLFKDVKLFPAGHFGKLNTETGKFNVIKYWDYDFSNTVDISYADAVNKLKELLKESITRQLVSDVPLGSYLSGGMDSSTLVAVAGSQIHQMPTFTGGFYMEGVKGREAEFDERKKAEFAANHYNLPNYQVVMNPHTMPNILEELVYYNDDLRVGQCWQNYTVAELASRFVKVVLCGAGGDELFAGYPWRYKIAENADNLGEFNKGYFKYWQRMVSEKETGDFFTNEINDKNKDYRLRDVYESVFKGYDKKFNNFYNRIFYFELKTFMQGLLLIEDKLSMAHGMEVRVPFLDNKLVDFVLKLPVEYKLGDEIYGGKKILRDAIKDLLPQEIFEHRKQGFSPPDENWYRNESSGYLHKQLMDDEDQMYSFINKDFVKDILDNHKSGSNERLLIWSLLNFKFWLRNHE